MAKSPYLYVIMCKILLKYTNFVDLYMNCRVVHYILAQLTSYEAQTNSNIYVDINIQFHG